MITDEYYTITKLAMEHTTVIILLVSRISAAQRKQILQEQFCNASTCLNLFLAHASENKKKVYLIAC